jgi:hypothetical protein
MTGFTVILKIDLPYIVTLSTGPRLQCDVHELIIKVSSNRPCVVIIEMSPSISSVAFAVLLVTQRAVATNKGQKANFILVVREE